MFVRFECFVVIDQHSQGANISELECICSVLTIIAKLCSNIKDIQGIYALGASKSGIGVMTHLGFDLIIPGDGRRDKHPVYRADIDTVMKKILPFKKWRLHLG